jgi:hypothetical protein
VVPSPSQTGRPVAAAAAVAAADVGRRLVGAVRAAPVLAEREATDAQSGLRRDQAPVDEALAGVVLRDPGDRLGVGSEHLGVFRDGRARGRGRAADHGDPGQFGLARLVWSGSAGVQGGKHAEQGGSAEQHGPVTRDHGHLLVS